VETGLYASDRQTGNVFNNVPLLVAVGRMQKGKPAYSPIKRQINAKTCEIEHRFIL